MAASTTTLQADVLVVGAGPVGMFMAYQLARNGISCVMLEQGTRTTSYPKMEWMNQRTMEILRAIGLEKRIRTLGIPETFPANEVFSSGLGRKDGHLQTIERDSPAALRQKWRQDNDGSHPLEPYMRVSQILVEAWLKPLCEAEPLIESCWGWKFNTLVEHDDFVLSNVTDAWGNLVSVKSTYVIGCDGAGSRVRSQANLEARRKPLPMHMYMVHFQSKDLETLYSQGAFWHLNFVTGGLIVNQDEVETFTYHAMIGPDAKPSEMNPLEMLTSGIGGIGGSCPLNVDRILKTSSWKANTSIASSFQSSKGRVFLAAHQLTPVGGLGLNSGIADTFDLTWKLTAVLKGYGGKHILQSYDHERRSVAKSNLRRVEEGMSALVPILEFALQAGGDALHSQTEDGANLRARLAELITQAQWVHDQDGTWCDYRYNHSPIVIHDQDRSEPPRRVLEYVPSTWPGSRAPHLFLSDGVTSIFDLYGPQFTIVDFTPIGEVSALFLAIARNMSVPIKSVRLPLEHHARNVWQRDVVLVRPDGHVAWTSPGKGVDGLKVSDIKEALSIATGSRLSPSYSVPEELQEDIEIAPEDRTRVDDAILPDSKTGSLVQLESLPAATPDTSLTGSPPSIVKVGIARLSVSELGRDVQT